MNSGDEADIKTKVLEFAEKNPWILLGAIAVLVLIIVIMYLNSAGYLEGMGGSKKKKCPADEDEIDSLISSIHSKQQKRKGSK